MKLYKTKKDPELYYYFNTKKEKMWMYRHRYYNAVGKRKEKSKQGFLKENNAYRDLLEVRTSILNGDTKQLENEYLTISSWLDIWYETKKSSWEVSTRKDRRRLIKKVIKPLIGKYKLSKLDVMTYEREFINELLDSYSPSTVKNYHTVFKVSVNTAVKNGTIDKNNFSSITIADVGKKTKNFLTKDDLNTLLSVGKREASVTVYSLMLLLASTGMRKGEAHGLTWSDINFEKRTIKIEHTRDDEGVRTPKTNNSYREIIIDDKLVSQLKSYHSWCRELKFSYGEHLAETDFVFLSRYGGGPIHYMTINQSLDPIIKKSGVKRITPHGFRHTHATILLNRKVSVATVAKRLGNTAEEINRTYGHSDNEADVQAMEIFSSVINS